MRNYKRKKLGVPLVDETLKSNIETNIGTLAPINLGVEGSESLKNDKALKSINIGNINNPNNIIVGNIEKTNTYYSIDNPDIKYFFARNNFSYHFNGQLYIYQSPMRDIDPDNPYDPIFVSFNRLTSFPPRFVQSGRLTGLAPSVSLLTESGNFRGTIYISTKDGFSETGVGGFNRYVSGERELNKFNRTQDSFSYNPIYGVRSGYMFGDAIDHFYWSTWNYGKGIQDFLVFDKSGELGYSGKWVGLSTAFCCGGKDIFAIANKFLTIEEIASLVRVVATSPNQSIYELPTTSWSGIGAPTLKLEFNNVNAPLVPTTTGWALERYEIGGKEHYLTLNDNSFTKENGGFYKIARTRSSYDVNHIYAKYENGGLSVGNITGDNTPSGYLKVTYPHSYLTKSFGALKYDAIIVPELIAGTGNLVASGQRYVKGPNDVVIVSTGVGVKKIVYVSPVEVVTFSGFWSEKTATNRAPKIKIRNTASGTVTGITPRFVSDLKSGSLLSVSSKNVLMPVRSDFKIDGPLPPRTTVDIDLYQGYNHYANIPGAMLKTTTSLQQHPFYKLYEPIFRPNAFQSTWDGIIPSGTPFQIEVVRTESNTYGLNNYQLSIYANNHFDQNTIAVGPSGFNPDPSGLQVITRKVNKSNLIGLYGYFEGRATVVDYISQDRANYVAEKRAYKTVASKINGALWDKGFSKGNSRARKIMKLFNGNAIPLRMYYYEYETAPNQIQKEYFYGVLTAGGVRQSNGDVITIPLEARNQGAKWLKFL